MTEEKRTEEKEAEDVKSADKKKKNRILNIVILCAVCIIAYGVFNMISLQKQYKRAGEEYARVQKTAGMDQAEDVSADPKKDDGDADVPEVPDVQVDLKSLQKENPDTVAWLYCPALGINYPVMQDEDNTYYIKHTFSGDKNAVGSIFLDAYGNKDFSDANTFIFGHNMRDGSMFGSMKNIRDEGTVKENPYFWIYTADGWSRYRIFSYHDANATKKDMAFQIKFENEQAHQQFLQTILDASEEKLGVEVTIRDKVVTLATCTSDASVRLVIHGVQKD